MEKLELKYLAAYLPYGLRVTKDDWNKTFVVTVADEVTTDTLATTLKYVLRTQAKPILRPLSDLTKEIEVNGEKFVPMDKLYAMSDYSEFMESIQEDVYEMNTPFRWPYEIVQKLFEWHFDVFDLLSNKLAIDINTI